MQDDRYIEELLNAKEGEHMRFKEAKNRYDMTEAARHCCALANCGGGMLVLGVTDRRPRQAVGCDAFEQPERVRGYLMDKLRIEVDFREYFYHEKRILIFEVESRPVGLPVQCDGIAWWYDADRLIPMSEGVRRRIYNEYEYDFSAEVCSGADLRDLDEAAVNYFRGRLAGRWGGARYGALSDEQFLRDCRAVTDEGITYAALILFGKPASVTKHLPHAEIVFEYRSSDASGPAAERHEFREGLFTCFDLIWDLIDKRNDRQHYQEKFTVYDIPTFNERAVREAVLNAVSHRDYRMGGSIFVRQYDGRLVVESPGGFPSGITLDNILDSQSARNPRVAEILALGGFVEHSGQGMNTIYETCVREAKRFPDFTGTDDYFVRMTLDGRMTDETMPSVIRQMGDEVLNSLSTEDFLTINAVYRGEPVSERMKPSLSRLNGMGVVEHLGRGRYVLSRALYVSAGKGDAYARAADRGGDSDREAVLTFIRQKGEEGAVYEELHRLLPGLSRYRITKLLNGLKDDGMIFSSGKNSGTRWIAGRR